jgi:hypothetical protein
MESAALISTLEHEHEHEHENDRVIWLRPEEAVLRPPRLPFASSAIAFLLLLLNARFSQESARRG